MRLFNYLRDRLPTERLFYFYMNLNTFIGLADQALYMAKRQGRNRLVAHPAAYCD